MVSKAPDERKLSAWQALFGFVLATLFAWAPGSEHPAAYSAEQAGIETGDRLHQAGFVEITSAPSPDQDDLDTLSEQLEDRLLAAGHPDFGVDAAAQAAPSEHGQVLGWAVCSPILPSSSARGPPLG